MDLKFSLPIRCSGPDFGITAPFGHIIACGFHIERLQHGFAFLEQLACRCTILRRGILDTDARKVAARSLVILKCVSDTASALQLDLTIGIQRNYDTMTIKIVPERIHTGPVVAMSLHQLRPHIDQLNKISLQTRLTGSPVTGEGLTITRGSAPDDS